MLIVACVYPQYLKTYGDRSHHDRRRSFSIESHFSLFLLTAYLKRQRSYTLAVWWCFLLHCASYPSRGHLNCSRTVSWMGTKMKGIYKGFKYTLSQIFVVKEDREMEIGNPTDVKHVAHIGWEGPSGSAPTWMNEFRTGQDYAATSIGNSGSALSPWSSQDFADSMRQQSESEMFKDVPSSEIPRMKKKEKRKKTKSSSSPKSSSSYSSRSSRTGQPKSKFIEEDPQPNNIKVS